MNRRAVEKLLGRVEQIRNQFLPGVSILSPGEGGTFRLMCNTCNGTTGKGGTTQETTHATQAEAMTAYQSFLQAHPAPSRNEPTLIIIDV